MMVKKKLSPSRESDVSNALKISSRLMKSRARQGYGVIPKVGPTVPFQSRVTQSILSQVGT
jgi:hypothetical protein